MLLMAQQTSLTEHQLRAMIAEEVQVAFSQNLARLTEITAQIDTQLQTFRDFREFQVEKDRKEYEKQMQQMIREQIELLYAPIFAQLNRPKIEKDPERPIDEWMKIMNDFGTDGNRTRIVTQYHLKRNTFYVRLSWFWCRIHGFEGIPPNHPADRFKGPIQNKTTHRGRQRSPPNPVGSI